VHHRRSWALPIVVLLAIAGWSAYFYEATLPQNRDANEQRADAGSPPEQTRSASSSTTQPEDPPLPSSRPEARPESKGTAGVPEPPASTDRNAAKPHPDIPAGRATAPPQPVASERAEPAHNVAGSWQLTTHVDSSSMTGFEGLSLGYEIEFEQTGSRVVGKGRKVTENGATIAAQAQTPISAAGTIDGDRLTLLFTERGAERASQGKFVLLAENGTLRGRFSSDAAQSSGTVEAHRQP